MSGFQYHAQQIKILLIGQGLEPAQDFHQGRYIMDKAGISPLPQAVYVNIQQVFRWYFETAKFYTGN
jgi:hypothetical protein